MSLGVAGSVSEVFLRSTYILFAELAIRKPLMIPLLLETLWVFRKNNWYKRFPFLPLPSGKYLRWRLETAYGDIGTKPPIQELERYIRWSASMRGVIPKEKSKGNYSG